MKIKGFTSENCILLSLDFPGCSRKLTPIQMLPISNLFLGSKLCHHLFHNTCFQFATILGSITQYYFPRSEHVSIPAVQNGQFHHSQHKYCIMH